VAKANGCIFTYHKNHSQEFIKFDGVYAEDILLQEDRPRRGAGRARHLLDPQGRPRSRRLHRPVCGAAFPRSTFKDMHPLTCAFTEVGKRDHGT